MKTLFYIVILVVLAGAAYLGYKAYTYTPENSGEVACTAEAMMCPDGSAVGRTGPNCEFAECPTPVDETPSDVAEHIASKADLIRVTSPEPYEFIESPLIVTGEARGYWFFEASFPVTLVDWDGLIIAEGYATAEGDWMTEEFVPFTATLEFEVPAYGVRGTRIL